MGINYTAKTREILGFIHQYGFITTRICSNMFFKDKARGYEQARVKLNNLVKNKDLEKWKCSTNEYIYQFKKKNISECDHVLLNFISEVNKVADILYFKKEEHWKYLNKRSDGHLIYDYKGNIGAFLIEIEKYSKVSNEKYKELFESYEVHKWYWDNQEQENLFPSLLIISPSGTTNIDNRYFDTVCLDFSLQELEKIL